MKMTNLAIVAALIWTTSSAVDGREAGGQGRIARVCAVSLSWASKDRTLTHVIDLLDRAAAQRAEIVCLPQECVPTNGGEAAVAALTAIAKTAARHKMYVVANLREKQADKLYLTSYLIGPDGSTVGKYRKSHRLPDEPIALGDRLPVFDTALGKVGLMIGTDHYWPEIPLVLSLQGAELILVSNGVEPVPQGLPLDLKMRVRALDDHATVACANYAGDLPYLCSNHPAYTGEPLGRAFIVDRSGVVVADTGMHAGAAVAPVDLARRKDIYFLTFKEDRRLFHYLVDPNLKPAAPEATRRKIKVSVATVGFDHGPNPKPDSAFAKILDEAGTRGGDLIVMSEFGMITDDDNGKKTLALVAEKARKYNTYIVVGGLRDPQIPDRKGGRTSWAYLWDRSGKVVGKYRISQYGNSVELPVFKTDFGILGIILCGDVYSQEISRSLALQGAEIICCPSQSWGASGTINLWMQQVRAIDNHVVMATAHFPMSDHSQRSYVIDPYGFILAASAYWSDSVCTADVDLDAGGVWFARSNTPGRSGKPGYLAGYYPKTIPEKRTDLRRVLLDGRRPELYKVIMEKTLAPRQITEEVDKKMTTPRE